MAFLPEELLQKLCSLVPPARVNLVRYPGALAPGARLRPAIVAQALADAERAELACAGSSLDRAPSRPSCGASESPPPPIPIVSDPVAGPLATRRRRYLLWVELLM